MTHRILTTTVHVCISQQAPQPQVLLQGVPMTAAAAAAAMQKAQLQQQQQVAVSNAGLTLQVNDGNVATTAKTETTPASQV